jgi:drug/metabolite transporter (DMT)-like permease
VNDTLLPDQKLSLCAGALAGSLCVLWGANTVAIKFCLSGLGPFSSAAVRFGCSAGFIWMWAKVSGQRLKPGAGQLRPLLINALLFFVQLALVYVGFTMTSASRGALLTNLHPFFLLFLAHFFLAGVFLAAIVLDEPMTTMILLALALITAGILIVQLGQRRDLEAILPGNARER